MISKKELMELLRSEEGVSEIADNILARLEPRVAKDVTKESANWPDPVANFDEAGRKLDKFAKRLGVRPRVPGKASAWAIRIGRSGNSYDVLELVGSLLDRVEALDAKLDRKSWNVVISSGDDD